jgi:hypothetical protein
MGSPISGPIAYLNNLPINPQWYSPRQQNILNITLGTSTTVTVTTNTEFVVGQNCRLLIPSPFGSKQLNGVQGNVISISSPTQIVLDIDSSRNVDPFIQTISTTLPQIIPIGDVNQGAINAKGPFSLGTFIPGSFIDISPD